MKNNKYTSFSSIRRLLNYLGKYKWVLFLSVFFTIIVTIIQIFTPILLGTIVNLLQNNILDNGTLDRNNLIRIVYTLIGMYVVLAISDILKERSLVYLSQTLTRDMREEVSEKIKKYH